MLKTIDKALAGAIDIVADQMQSTVKEVREQGVMRTLGDAIETTGSTVATYTHTALDHLGVPKNAPPPEPGAGQVFSSYADLCSGGAKAQGAANGGGAAAGLQYIPQTSTNDRGFGAGIGIQRATPPEAAAAPQTAVSTPVVKLGPEASPAGKEPQLAQENVKAWFERMRREDPANSKCFDCGCAGTEWASVSFGCLLCLQCAGKHRGLGTHISRIRSISMDAWTDRQLQIFLHGGNSRLRQFFEANDLKNMSPPQSLYLTPGAEWYREAWIKNRTFDRPVPPPPAGVVEGPCVDGSEPPVAIAQASPVAKAAPACDLLDFGSEPAARQGGADMDLLGFGSDPVAVTPIAASAALPARTPAADVDLLGFGGAPAPQASVASGGGDLLGLGPCEAVSSSAQPASGNLLDFNSIAAPAVSSSAQPTQSGNLFDFNSVAAPAATPAPAPLLGFDFYASSSLPSAAAPGQCQGGATSAAFPSMTAAAAPSPQSNGNNGCFPAYGAGAGWQANGALTSGPAAAPSCNRLSGASGGGGAAVPAGNTLAGGARLAAPPKEDKADDPFAMALSKWQM